MSAPPISSRLAMMFKFTAISFITLLACTGVVNPICLPCQRPYGDKSKTIPSFDFYQDLELRAVYNPHITSPHTGTRWIAGSRATVRWDASDEPPADATNRKGRIVLGYLNNGGDEMNEHLDNDHPLADGFEIKQGSVDVTVPEVEPRDNYIVVLFGDSGNRSQKFTIARP